MHKINLDEDFWMNEECVCVMKNNVTWNDPLLTVVESVSGWWLWVKDVVHLIWLCLREGECVCASISLSGVNLNCILKSFVYFGYACACFRGLWSPLLALFVRCCGVAHCQSIRAFCQPITAQWCWEFPNQWIVGSKWRMRGLKLVALFLFGEVCLLFS